MSGTPYNISNPNRGFYDVAITEKPENGLTLESFQNKAYPSTATNTGSQPSVKGGTVGMTQNCTYNIATKFNTCNCLENSNCPNILM